MFEREGSDFCPVSIVDQDHEFIRRVYTDIEMGLSDLIDEKKKDLEFFWDYVFGDYRIKNQ